MARGEPRTARLHLVTSDGEPEPAVGRLEAAGERAGDRAPSADDAAGPPEAGRVVADLGRIEPAASSDPVRTVEFGQAARRRSMPRPGADDRAGGGARRSAGSPAPAADAPPDRARSARGGKEQVLASPPQPSMAGGGSSATPAEPDGDPRTSPPGMRGRRGRAAGPRPIDPDADPVEVAREICLTLLAGRARTKQELADVLRRRLVPEEAARAVLDRFDEVGLIDDAAFAGQWVRSRQRQRGLARRAIAVELRRKGVDDEVAAEALAEVDASAEEERARELVRRKLRTVPAGTPEQRATAARRLVGMLARKGYPSGVAYRVVREELAAHGADVDELGTEPLDD